MSTRHIAAEEALLSDLTPEGSSGAASKRFRNRLAADGFTVDEGFRLKPGYIYTVVRAISARVNQNYDGWPSEELKKAYKTFIGKPCFVNHENHDPTKARGVVVASRYVENGADRYVEVVQEIDAQRFPKLAHEIKTGGMDSVSMGAEAGFTICSYCYNKATDLHDMCDHVRNHKGKTLTRFDKRTGKKEDVLVFESCLVPGTPILMADGTTKGIEQVRVGDRVIDHLGESRLVTEAMSRLVTEDIVRLRRTGHPGWLELTGNHPMLVVRSADAAYPSSRDGKQSFSKEAFARKLDQGRVRPEFIEAGQVREGDWVVEVVPQRDGGITKIVTADYTAPRGLDWVGEQHVPDISGDVEFFPEGLYEGRWKNRRRQPWIRRHCHAEGCDAVMELRPSDRARMYCSSACAGTWRKGKNIADRNGNLARHTLPDTVELTESFGRLVGWFLAEGSVSPGAVNFALHADEARQAQEIVDLARDCLGLTSATIFNPTPTTLSVTVFSAPFARLMSVFGTRSADKGLPDEFMSAPLEFLRGVADAHELGDGLHGNEASPEDQRKDSVRPHVHRHFTVSDRLASQLYLIHLMLGRTPSQTTKAAFRDNWLPLHDVWWKNLAARHGRNTLTVRGKMAYGPWVFTRVRDVQRRPYSGPVHNLEVADSHTYTATGLAVHNCHKISFFELSYVFEPADETAVASKVVVAGLNKKVNGWASRKREDPRNETYEAPGLPNGKFSAVNLSRNVPYVGHNIPVSEGNYYRSLHTDSFDSLFDKDGVMRGNGRGGTDNLSFMSGNPLEMYTNGITKSNTIIEGDSRLPISSTDKRSGYSYVPQLNRTDVDSGATPLRVWRRKAVGSEPIESVHNWEKVYDSFPSEHRQAGKHTKQGFAADIAEITKLAGECPPEIDRSRKGLPRGEVAGLNKEASYEDDLAEWNHYRDVGRRIRPGKDHVLSDDSYKAPLRDPMTHPVIEDFLRHYHSGFPREDIDGGEYGVDRVGPGMEVNYVSDRNDSGKRLDEDEQAALARFLKQREEEFPDRESWWREPERDGMKPSGPGYDEYNKYYREASLHKHAGECPPGMDCSRKGLPQGEQITKDSPNNPVNQVSYSPDNIGQASSSTGGGGGAGGYGDAKEMAHTKGLYEDLMKTFPGADIGTFRVDDFHEHDHGAMDFMTSDDAQAAAVREKAFASGAPYVLWKQQQWNSDGSVSGMENRGDPTQNHFDHVHIAPIPVPAAPEPAATAAAPSPAPTQRAAGKYTKDDFAIADGKKPWEREAPKSAPVEEDADLKEIEAMVRQAAPEVIPQNSQRTQRSGTESSYRKVHDFFDSIGAPHDGGADGVLDYGAGLGHSAQWGHTYEPYPREDRDFRPSWVKPEDVPSEKFNRVTNLHVLNVVPPEIRHQIVDGIGSALAPGGHAVIMTRSRNDVDSTVNKIPVGDSDPGAYHIGDPGNPEKMTYQKGFTPQELHQYISERLGPGYSVSRANIGSAPAVHVVKNPKSVTARRRVRSAALRKVAHNRAMKLAWGEVEAPAMVDTLREEGSAPEDDNNDFERYVDPPEELADPDLSAASRIDRQQEMQGTGDPAAQGVPGAAEGGAPPQQPQQQFITLQVPVPAAQDAGVPMAATPAAAAPQAPPMAPPQQPQQVMASTLDYFERYYGRRIANWMDAIEARRELTPEEKADYRRQTASLSTLENSRELSTTNRNPTKGTANMARTNIASRTKVATAGRRQHFAEGPLVDGGDRSRNNQGEQEEAFISQTPPEVSGEFPGDDAHNISNTEHNLVARVQRGRDQLLRDANQLASIRQRRAFDEAGGPVATTVDPKVQTGPEGEALTGDDFTSANPNEGVSPTNPKDASLRAFRAFDGWLAQKTGKSSRRHNEATIKKAAAQFSREAGISPQALFPALGIVLREARKSEKQANSKGASMRKRSNESLEVAAPDARIDVVSPVKNVSDAKAQASQFSVHDFGNNAGDGVAKPDLSTDQNWAPGEASKTSARVKTAGGLLAMRCAEGMIEAGLEPNSRDRKYQLAAEFENMNRNLIQDRVALLERFAAVRQADLQRVASGSSRGAARSPIPAGLGGGTRTAATGQRLAAHDPRNDSSLFI